MDVTDGTASEYLREKIGVPALNEIYASKYRERCGRCDFSGTGSRKNIR